MSTKTYMAIGHYGTTIHGLGPRPRKDLLERLGASSAQRIYRDIDGKTFHVGYIIGKEWFDIFEVKPFMKEV